ncbi:MAG: hypothetical protein JWL59_1033 [Chthoniobacteraceae bacterium]|nr:hypothetical protein [Chthoniobacteraceae bacterium]
MIFKYLLPVTFLFCTAFAQGAQTTVNASSGGLLVKDKTNNLLSAGISGDGNGSVIQIGYYSAATTANNFAGEWIALSGEGSANTGGVVTGSNPAEPFNKTSIGDVTFEGAADGSFGLQLAFVAGDALTGNNLPTSTSIPLSIRFYDKTTIAGSSFFNVVSNDLWTWKTPTDTALGAIIQISLNSAGAEWQDASSPLITTIAVPEPTSAMLLLTGIAGLALRRKRVL